jgi:hypothetical protein
MTMRWCDRYTKLITEGMRVIATHMPSGTGLHD